MGKRLRSLRRRRKKNAPDVKSKYQIQTRLTDFHMLNESTGIAWGLTNTSLRLYLTEDYGETWVNISPASNVKFAEKLVYGRDLVFTDRKNGWIVRSGRGSTEPMLLNTTDGGREWKLSSLPNAGEITAISFTSSRNGWIMTAGETAPGSQEKLLYRTQDNGETWKTVMQNSEYPASRVPGTVIPRTGLITGMTFADSNTGFATVKEMRGFKLYATKDGGSKWKSLDQVFQDDQMNKFQSYSPDDPGFLGSTAGVWVPVTCYAGNKIKYKGYFSKNGGKSWELVSFPLSPKTLDGNIAPVFRRFNEGWSVVDGIVYSSNDMGKTWTAYERDPGLAKNLERYPIISKMQFASPDVGWMLVETADESRSRLLLSMDGGATWRVR
ncbi:WD40/YVTN/BNR-like repeat-containing protein [Paenibacillus sp. DMB20]|uniref:WD40/YVTN/BNR-like repeat-containing protein n=1 Tax=Paenibacillus sp. DMB20 TaxID=1642570 RepID=UPI000A4B5F17|nr:YCF48-related protein [Paenibacillus sp. DMB20]